MAELPRDVAEDLLARLDRAVPGRIQGFYVVGSASMGAFRAGRSDVDFVAIVDGELRPAELRRLRALHVGRWISSLIHDTALRGRWPLICNGVYITAGDLSRSPLEVTPLAGHVAGRFRAASRDGFDVNPVTWYVIAHHGVALRGPDRDRLPVRTDEAELREWVLANLNGYWRRWSARVGPVGLSVRGGPPRRLAASGVLGAP
ncbi:MAG: nucleotidyltransferase domain-containing protein, partial [Solirubrobacterales bacterium]|nr:nucleotidyltransferase domain-containing protein [Solirubrobacterales bacterium]